VDIIGDDAVSVSQGIGFSILSLVKVIVSGFALIYIVMIGVYMVIFSDNEEKVKTQRRQITYALV
jgi:lipoprotein signal peptidase